MVTTTRIDKIAAKFMLIEDFSEGLIYLGQGETLVTGDDFKEWKEEQGETFTWNKVAKVVGLTPRRCTDFSGFGDEPIPERVAKIVILSVCARSCHFGG